MLTSLGSYGALSAHEQADVMTGISLEIGGDDDALKANANQLDQIARRRRP